MKTEKEIVASESGETPPMSKKYMFHSTMRRKYSDIPEDDEEGYYGKLNDEYNSLSEYQTKNRETNKQIAEVLQAEPSLARVIKGIAEGMTLREALSRFVDIEGLEAMEGDPDYEKLTAAKESRMAEMQASQKAIEDFASNMEMSMKEMNDFATENNMSEEEVAGFIKYIDDVVEGFMNGKLSKDHLSAWRKSQNYEADIKDAADMAAVDARNEKIEVKKSMKKSDDIPDLAGGMEASNYKTPTKQSDSVFMDAVAQKNNRKYIS